MTTMAEPEWDQDTRELVTAYDHVDLCPRCGLPTEVCQNPDRQFDWVAPPPVRCHATTAVLQSQRGVTEETNPQAQALIWPGAVLRDELYEDGEED